MLDAIISFKIESDVKLMVTERAKLKGMTDGSYIRQLINNDLSDVIFEKKYLPILKKIAPLINELELSELWDTKEEDEAWKEL